MFVVFGFIDSNNINMDLVIINNNVVIVNLGNLSNGEIVMVNLMVNFFVVGNFVSIISVISNEEDFNLFNNEFISIIIVNFVVFVGVDLELIIVVNNFNFEVGD